MRPLFRLLPILALVAAMLVPLAPPSRAEGEADPVIVDVAVRDFRFDPAEVRIRPGDSVRWSWASGEHRARAADGSFLFDFDGPEDVFTVPFPTEGTVEYRCDFHSMSGTITVARPAANPDQPTVYVPTDVATLTSAVDGARPDQTIVVESSLGEVVLDAPLRVTARGVTITSGEPPVTTTTTTTTATTTTRKPKKNAPPAESTTTTVGPWAAEGTAVRLRSGTAGPVEAAIVVAASEVTIERLRIEHFDRAGIIVEADAARVVLQDLVLAGNRDYGIESSGNVAITGVRAEGSRRAGVSLRSCASCGLVTGLTAAGNFVGLEVIDGAGVVVERSTVQGNANGVVIQTRPASSTSSAALFDNVIVDNDVTDAPMPTVFEAESVQPSAGVGIWLAGAQFARVEGNAVSGHRWGVVASALGRPASDDAVVGNRVVSSTQGDLSWDGIGSGTCFSANDHGSSQPPAIEVLYPCAGAGTVGVPYPIASADLALHALRTYYCRDLVAC